MRTVKDLVDRLFSGELSSLAIAMKEAEEVSAKDRRKLVNIINDSLTEIYTRFELSIKELIVVSHEWKNLYLLVPEHAVMNPAEELKYIYDTPNYEFTGDIIKILEVTNEAGCRLPLNQSDKWASVFTPRYNELQLNHVSDEQAFNVLYQASHPKIEEDNWLNTVLEIPPVMENILRALVCYKFYSGMSGQGDGEKAESFQMKYELLCETVDMKSQLNRPELTSNHKLDCRRYV